MQSAMQEINADYQAQVDTIKANTAHDVLEISGGAAWKETLAVYAVKTSMDPNNPQEVATMDDAKKPSSKKYSGGCTLCRPEQRRKPKP